MKRYAILMALAAMLCGTEAGAANISFDGLSGTFPPSGGYSEEGFSISASGNWSAAGGAIGNTNIGEDGTLFVDITTEYLLKGIDLSSFSGTTTFIITGFDDVDGQPPFVFTFNVNLTNTSERISFVSLNNGFTVSTTNTSGNPLNIVVNPSNGSCLVNSDCQIQRLSIGVVTPDSGTFKIDNICTNAPGASCPSYTLPNDPNGTVPEPASLLLLGAGLAGIGIWRRKAAR